MNAGITKVYRRDNQPFAQIPNEAIRDPEISASGFRLLAYLMSHSDGYELTYGQIERETGMGRWAINEAIKNLTGKGWLETKATKMPNGQYGPKAWFVLNPSDTSASVGFSTAGNSTTEKPTDIRRTLLREEHSREELNVHFDDFWKVFPRKQGKGEARRAFEKALEKAPWVDVLAGAVRYANDPNRVDSYTTMPATWLNQERWDDEPLPERVLTAEERKARELAEITARREREEALRAEERRLADLEAEKLRLEREQHPVVRCEHNKRPEVCLTCLRKKS